jgi:hypothetical protein
MYEQLEGNQLILSHDVKGAYERCSVTVDTRASSHFLQELITRPIVQTSSLVQRVHERKELQVVPKDWHPSRLQRAISRRRSPPAFLGTRSTTMHQMTPRPRTTPEPNFAQLVTEGQIPYITVSAHALRRFVERLQPDIPGADQVAEAMARLEDIGSGRRSGPEQAQLNRYRDWMATHVEPHVLELIRCEGFWANERPRWSMSRTRSDALLQVGGMCLWPASKDAGRLVLTTCTNGRDITWDIALARHYTSVPKPYAPYSPERLRPPSWPTIAARAWRARAQHKGLLAAFRAERARAIEHTQRENERRQVDAENSQRQWQEQRDRAARAFRERHQ